METILDITKVFMSSVCFSLSPTDFSWKKNLLFMSANCIGIFFVKIAPVAAIMDAISLLSGSMDNAPLHVSAHFPDDKIEEWMTFSLSHARLYLAESDDERDDKSDAAKIFDISCGGGGYSSSLLAITVSVSDTSDIFCC